MKNFTKGIVIGAVSLFAVSATANAASASEAAFQELNQGVVTTVATYRNGQLVSIGFSYEFVDGEL